MLDVFQTTVETLPQEEPRNISVYVPDFGDEGGFPVLYMFDGQNLFFDEEASFGKSWGMLRFLEENGVPLIVVGEECNHHGEQEPCGGRLSEYSPFDFVDRRWGPITGRGKSTMDWIVGDLKPYIDVCYPTRRGRSDTFIAGSSMGGLMALYALMEYNDVFSRAAALSPSLLFSPRDVEKMIRNAVLDPDTLLYMDCGSEELNRRGRSAFAGRCADLVRKGVKLEARIVPGGTHSEASWEKQVPFFMDALFYGL